MVDGVKCGPDGVRCDVDGNVWCSSNAGRAVGYSGVTVWTPEGKLIGRIRLPEVCGNVCFGGPKRNRLFMAASQSLYAVYVERRAPRRAEAPGSALVVLDDRGRAHLGLVGIAAIFARRGAGAAGPSSDRARR